MIFKRKKQITLHKWERKEIKIPRETRRNPLSMFFAHRERERERERERFILCPQFQDFKTYRRFLLPVKRKLPPFVLF